jgi:hypothetical protein
MNLVNGPLSWPAYVPPDKGNERVGAPNHDPTSLGCVADEIIGKQGTPSWPVFGIEKAAVLRLELSEGFEIV